MIVTCQNCDTSFQLDESRVPAQGIRVRCSRCKEAFFLAKPSADPDQAIHGIAAEAARSAGSRSPTATRDLGASPAIASAARQDAHASGRRRRRARLGIQSRSARARLRGGFEVVGVGRFEPGLRGGGRRRLRPVARGRGRNRRISRDRRAVGIRQRRRLLLADGGRHRSGRCRRRHDDANQHRRSKCGARQEEGGKANGRRS